MVADRDAYTFGRLQGEFAARNISVAAFAREKHLAWSSMNRALEWRPTSSVRKVIPRAALKKRAALQQRLQRLANKVMIRNGRKLPAHPSVGSIAKATLAFLARKGVNLMPDWPAYSPDLSMAELAWPLLNRGVANRAPRTLEQLTTAIVEAWAEIPQEKLDSIARGWLAKLRRCIERRGHP